MPISADKPRRRSLHPSGGPGGASPDDSHATDVNALVAQYRKNGTLPTVYVGTPLYGDFTGPTDLQEQMERVYAAEDRFNQLPAAVRKASDNDPVKFLALLETPDGVATLKAAGLILSDDPMSDTPESPSPPFSARPVRSESERDTPPAAEVPGGV